MLEPNRQVTLPVNAPYTRLTRKPYAGNPHVRFDEGEGFLRNPLYSTEFFQVQPSAHLLVEPDYRNACSTKYVNDPAFSISRSVAKAEAELIMASRRKNA